MSTLSQAQLVTLHRLSLLLLSTEEGMVLVSHSLSEERGAGWLYHRTVIAEKLTYVYLCAGGDHQQGDNRVGSVRSA